MATDRYPSKIIGAIAGCPVEGRYYSEDGEPSLVALDWNGMHLESDGAYVWLPSHAHEIGGFTVADWANVTALAQTDIMEQLIALGQQWAASDPYPGATVED
jgi:hypothetical protein